MLHLADRAWRAATWVLATLVAAGLVGVWVAGSLGSAPAAAPVRVSNDLPAGITVSTSVGAAALFQVNGMTPGSSVQRCTDVSYVDATADGEVTLSAASSGVLRDSLLMTVQTGAATGGSCTAFAGTTIFTGTLTAFTAEYPSAATGLRLFAVRSGQDKQGLRVAFTLADDAPQGAAASATFRWTAQQAAPPTTPAISEPPAPSPSVTPSSPAPSPSSPVPSSPASSSPAPSTPTPSVSATPSAAAPPAPTGGDGTPPATPEGKKGTGLLDKLVAAARETGRMVAVLAAPTARAIVVPVLLALIVLLFLAVHDRIDRSDPKLARAPVRRPDSDFTDRDEFPDRQEWSR